MSPGRFSKIIKVIFKMIILRFLKKKPHIILTKLYKYCYCETLYHCSSLSLLHCTFDHRGIFSQIMLDMKYLGLVEMQKLE